MRRLPGATAAAAVLALAFGGCRGTKAVLADYESRLAGGKFAEAVAEPAAKADEGGGDALCWQLNAAAAAHLARSHDEAIRRFDLAEDLFGDYEGRGAVARAGEGVVSMMTGDYALPYAGEGQDRVFTCLYKAIDFGAKGKMAAVRTELNRAMLHQSSWLSDRCGAIADAAKRMQDDAQKYAQANGGKMSSAAATNRIFASTAFAAKLRQGADFDVATGGRLDLLAAADYTNAYLLNVNEIFRRDIGDSGPKPEPRVTVFVEDGLCPVRTEWRLDLPLFLVPGLGRYVKYAGVALPKLRYRNEAVTAYSVTAGGCAFPMTLIQDVDRLVKTEFDIYFRGALAREITRAVVRAGAQVALGAAAESDRNGSLGLALKLVQTGVAAYDYCVTDADLRCWAALPKKVYMIDLPRPADGKLVVNCGHEQVKVDLAPDSSMVFVRKTSAVAPAVVRAFAVGD